MTFHVSLEKLLGDVWGRRILHFPGAAELPGNLLTIDDVHSILCDGRLRVPQAVLSQNGKAVATHSYTYSRRIGGTQVPGFLRIESVTAILSAGGSLRLGDLPTYWPPVQEVCDALTMESGLFCSATAFLSPPGFGAAGLHQDAPHVLAVQVAGVKHWQVHNHIDGLEESGPITLPPRTGDHQKITLTPGDLLYMPPLRPHQALSGDTWSLHIGFTLRPVNIKEIIEQRVGQILASMPTMEMPPQWARTDVSMLKATADKLGTHLRSTEWDTLAHDGKEAKAALDLDASAASLARCLGIDRKAVMRCQVE